MKKGGIIGGVSWHSTMDLYAGINEYAAKQLGGLNCAELMIINVNLNDIVTAENREKKIKILVTAAKKLQIAGCDYFTICSNGLHQFADEVSDRVEIPLLHIAEVTAQKIKEADCRKAGLIGVKETMEDLFYREKLESKGISVLIPEADERAQIDRILFSETGMGIVKPSSSQFFYNVAGKLKKKGADCIILGCTEIRMLMQQNKTDIPLMDTTDILAEKMASLYCE